MVTARPSPTALPARTCAFCTGGLRYHPTVLNKAFSLIELLVVIAIIGILSSIVMASLSSARLRSRDSRRVADMKQVQIGLELYYDEFGSYPRCDNQANARECFGDMTVELNSKGYIPSKDVKDPLLGASYSYVPLAISSSGTKCKSYHLGAVLEGVSGNTGVLADDSDAAPGGAGCNTSARDFPSLSANCIASGGDLTNDKCYDLKP